VVLVLSVAFPALGALSAAVLARLAWVTPVRARLRATRPVSARGLPQRLRDPLSRVLTDAHVTMTPEDALLVYGTAVGVAGLLAFAVAPVLAPVAAAVVALAVPVGLVLVRGRATRRFLDALPSFVELMAARLRSGHTIATALADAATRHDPVASDVRRVLQRAALGHPLSKSLAWWGDERRLDPVRAVAGSLAVAFETGGGAAPALEGLARSLRDQLGARAEAGALSAQARLSAVVVGVAPIAYVLFAAAADRRAASLLVTSSTGRVCLVVGLALDALAALWMRRIVRSEP